MGKFRIKIIAWLHSDDYVQFKYSTNGIIWHKIRNCERDILDNWYYMKPLTISYKDAESTVSKFQSLDDIHKYEQSQKDKVTQYNADIDANNKRIRSEKAAVYNRFKTLK